MRSALRHSTAAFVIGVLAGTAVAADDAALKGPAAAIAKARAAAEQADARTAAGDHEAAKVHDPASAAPVADAPAGKPDAEAAAGAEGGAASGSTSYDRTAHRDPFMPLTLKGSEAVAARTPLETYQLGQLKLVGVIAQSEEGYRAMVEDSAGLGYIITTGTPIGSSGGVVRCIEPRRVVIEESTRDFYGDVKAKEVVMELPQEDRSP
jgi:hypothetical protein